MLQFLHSQLGLPVRCRCHFGRRSRWLFCWGLEVWQWLLAFTDWWLASARRIIVMQLRCIWNRSWQRESYHTSWNLSCMDSGLTWHRNAEVGLGLICACLPAINVLTSWTRSHSPSVKGYFNRRRNKDQPSGHIYDGPTTNDGRSRNQFVHSHLSSCARRGSTDSAQLIANHEELGMPAGDNNDGIIKMVSLNQHWENASHRCVWGLKDFAYLGRIFANIWTAMREPSAPN